MSDWLDSPVAPMEARLVGALPDEPGWQFEPKWDGFRAVAVREGARIVLWSKSGKPLGRYFPELEAMLLALACDRFALDGEIILPIGDTLSFDALQQRLHPAASRIARLSRETPAQFMLFDALRIGGDALDQAPLAERRGAMEAFHRRHGGPSLLLSPCSAEAGDGERWLVDSGGALDGVIAKPPGAYEFGERAMRKVKQLRTADCVVGGYRLAADGRGVGSLLLGLYDDAGLLDHVGFTSGLSAEERVALRDRLAPLTGGAGFTGKAPGGPSRWATERSAEWVPLAPELVVEVVYDQITAGRFRHGTRLLRWRPDKRPDQCTRDQLIRELRPAELATIV